MGLRRLSKAQALFELRPRGFSPTFSFFCGLAHKAVRRLSLVKLFLVEKKVVPEPRILPSYTTAPQESGSYTHYLNIFDDLNFISRYATTIKTISAKTMKTPMFGFWLGLTACPVMGKTPDLMPCFTPPVILRA